VVFEARDRRFGGTTVYELVSCVRCGLVRTEPQDEEPTSHYPDEYYSYAPPEPLPVSAQTRIRRAYGLPTGSGWSGRVRSSVFASRLTTGLPPGPLGSILDVGCGSGEMLLALRAAGWECHGLEVDERAVAAARSAGLGEVRQGDLTDDPYPPESFDAVRFWHSLEHVRSPRAQLVSALRVLKPAGTLTVGVPNFRSLLSRAFRDRSFYLDVPRHRWHFDERTLRRLVNDSGFEVTHTRMRTGSEPCLGTVAYLRGRRPERRGRYLWYATLPAAALLDTLRLGDALELYAAKPERASSPSQPRIRT
jgi:SAM-dependent methyltransferase